MNEPIEIPEDAVVFESGLWMSKEDYDYANRETLDSIEICEVD